jgi:hypothetical protein
MQDLFLKIGSGQLNDLGRTPFLLVTATTTTIRIRTSLTTTQNSRGTILKDGSRDLHQLFHQPLVIGFTLVQDGLGFVVAQNNDRVGSERGRYAGTNLLADRSRQVDDGDVKDALHDGAQCGVVFLELLVFHSPGVKVDHPHAWIFQEGLKVRHFGNDFNIGGIFEPRSGLDCTEKAGSQEAAHVQRA